VNNALKVFLSDEYSIERDSAILRRLDRMTRENERFNQKLAIQSEALAGFMLYFMRVTPQPPEAEKAAAIARGDKQFDQLIDNLKTRLESTSKSLFGTFEDVYADESAFFSEEELDRLHRPDPREVEGDLDTDTDGDQR